MEWVNLSTAWKVAEYGDFSGANTRKYGPEKTSYLDNFHAVFVIHNWMLSFLLYLWQKYQLRLHGISLT